ncbi:MAG: MFS transporter [Candidatus Korobacteraceae bacterium]
MQNSSSPAFDSTRAWVVACAAFVASFVAYGFLYAFGVFLRPMGSALGVGHAVMATLFSCMSLSGYLLGPLTGDWADHVGPRKVMMAGAVVFTAGVIATAHATSFLVAFPCLGIGVGAGLASVYVPSLAAVGEWFKKERDVALGVAVSGIGVGTLVAAPLGAWLVREYGWRNTLTIEGLAGGALLLLSGFFMFKPPVKVESKKGSRAVWAKVRSRAFLMVFLSRLLSGIPVFVTMVYLPALATKEGVGAVSAAALVGYIGAGSLLSRIGLNTAAEKIGAIVPFQFSCVLVAVACVIWRFAYSYPALIVFVVVMGISYGGVASLTPAVAIQLFGLESIGELLGFLLLSYGVAAAVGPPIAGLLVDRSGNYRDIIWFALIASLAGIVTSLLIKRAQPAPEADASEAAA